ncbi:cystathionine beta-l [Wallemia mellicola]|nr:cystathionine beta-l [Wallemia mellicola]
MITPSTQTIMEGDLSSSVATLPTSVQPSRSVSPSMSSTKKYRFSTECVTIDNPNAGKDQYNSSSVPIYQSATFKGMNGEYDYSRSGNPTRTHLEHHLAKISSAKHAFAVSSGMAALDIIARILKPGDEVIAGDDLYGGTNRLLGYLKSNAGVIVHHIDTCTPSTVEQYLNKDTTRLVLLETPTNPLIKICDVKDVADRVKASCPDAIIVVDNTMMSPYLQRPLDFGADIVYDSATKYLSGHHDLMAGVVVCNRDDLAKHMGFTINSVGNGLSPFDSFLLLRGLKTLAIRMDRQQATARIVASFLNKLGFVVHYPGLSNHPGHDTHFKLARGAGAVLSFETKDIKTSERIVGSAKLWGISVSFGAVNSLISMPCLMSHASIPAHLRAERGLPEDLIRLCVGIEDYEDLIDDLENSLVQSGAIRTRFTPAEENWSSEIGSLERIGEERAMVWEKCSMFEEQPTVKAASTAETKKEGGNIVVSAPGKVILFGEHAVVYGVTAIASSLDLRCYGCLSPRSDNSLSISFPDLDTDVTLEIEALPWKAVKNAHDDILDIDHELVAALENHFPAEKFNSKARGAIISFFHHYMSICYNDRRAVSFSARSDIPIGAGLGSSAAYSTCVSTALLILAKKVAIEHTHNATHISHDGRRFINDDIAKYVNKWSFVSEKILHGTPSGIDNSVSVFGGAISYSRVRDQAMINLNGFKSMKLLLTNSNVDRDAKKLIAGVAKLKQEEPEVVKGVMDGIQGIVDEAVRCFNDKDLNRNVLLTGLSELVRTNHGHLDRLGVSHPTLEIIISKLQAYNLKTKLTGAGGGGCTVTLIPDDYDEKELGDALQKLQQAGFNTYLTTVGGSGLGYLIEEYNLEKNTQSTNEEESVGPFTSVFSKDFPTNELNSKLRESGHWVFV